MAKRTNSVEPVALASIVETLPGSWLCNVQPRRWPVALGSLSLVMRAAYVFRQPGGQEWVEVESRERTPSPTLQPLAVEAPPLPALQQPPFIVRNFEVAVEK